MRRINNVSSWRILAEILSRDQYSVNDEDYESQTALHLAAGGPVSIVLALLEAGAEVDSLVSSSLATPLHMAALAGNTNTVIALLDSGAKLQPRAGESLYGATPLYLAAQNGHTETVRALLGAPGLEVVVV